MGALSPSWWFKGEIWLSDGIEMHSARYSISILSSISIYWINEWLHDWKPIPSADFSARFLLEWESKMSSMLPWIKTIKGSYTPRGPKRTGHMVGFFIVVIIQHVYSKSWGRPNGRAHMIWTFSKWTQGSYLSLFLVLWTWAHYKTPPCLISSYIK